MQYLHSRDIIHGGLKPTNILIKDSGEACVSDWAMVEVQPSRNKEAHRYFSPEAWKGVSSEYSFVIVKLMVIFRPCRDLRTCFRSR
ncbi:hypothetical protein ARMGADRAFT_935510 [Armillaria gallica]|uniref:Protein kinase domain-containing protein n=2 Tax=Armillaria TaxID=47424 RepID=A0A2H3DN95_ARMGA|nr:hypothetical protein ARMGADRAFT_935510 [Armillaria gallica]